MITERSRRPGHSRLVFARLLIGVLKRVCNQRLCGSRGKAISARMLRRDARLGGQPCSLPAPEAQALSVDVTSVALRGGVVFRSGPLDENLIRHSSCVRLGDEAVDK